MSGARSTLFGASTMVGANILRVIVQAAVLPIIGRLLGPEAYGLIALVTPFLFFSMLLAESGLGSCIVRAPDITPALEATIFTFSAAFSLAVIAAFALLAYPLGALLHEPGFPPLLIGMSGILLLASLNIVPASLLLRQKKYDWVALSDVVSSACSLAGVGVGIYFGWGVWSLVAQQFGLWLGKVVIVTLGSRWRPRLGFDWALFKGLFRFGSNLTASAILGFICRNIDNVLIGAILGATALGYYALAFQIVSLPQMVISSSAYLTILSTSSEAHRQGRDAAPAFLRMFKGVFLIIAPLIVGLAVTADQSLPLVMGSQWLPSARLLFLLAPFGLCQTAGAALGGYIVGIGRTDIALRMTVVTSVGTIIAIVLGVKFGSDVVAIGVSVMAVTGFVIGLVKLSDIPGMAVAASMRAMLPALVSAVIMGGGVYLYQRWHPVENAWLMLITSILLGAGLYALALLTLFGEHIRDDLRSIRAALTKKPVEV